MERNSLVKFLNQRKFTVLFSGGKDSLATLLWVLEYVVHDDWNVLYVEVTGNTCMLCNDYVHRVAKELGIHNKLIHVNREDADFFVFLKRYGIPIIGKYRWCLYQFKVPLFRRYSYVTQVVGIKHSDSYRRRIIKQIEVFRSTGNVVVNPILTWDDSDVQSYIRQHGIEINPCYHVYGHSGNCMFCPYHGKAGIIRTLNDPNWRGKIIAALAKVRAESNWMRKIKQRWLTLSKQTILHECQVQ